ncbi:MAG TPA: helix-hairpin-helix domain-containing protein [Sedimentisphaerales bacterium]|nr:helix-hairpin-helix domain-containing protein [Sedimentisphaerales bacterium]
MKKPDLRQLKQIPGVGENIAQDMWDIGIRSVNDLRGRNAERLYQRLCDFKASPVDKCMLYVFRCAIYYASNTEHDPELLKWWNWKDRSRTPQIRRART